MKIFKKVLRILLVLLIAAIIDLTEIISDRQAEIPNTLDESAERVREEEYTRDKTECYRYG